MKVTFEDLDEDQYQRILRAFESDCSSRQTEGAERQDAANQITSSAFKPVCEKLVDLVWQLEQTHLIAPNWARDFEATMKEFLQSTQRRLTEKDANHAG